VLHWCPFLAAKTDRELEELSMAHPEIRDAKNALEELSADPKARRLAEDRAIWHYTYDDGLATARDEGLAKGRAEGPQTAIRSLCRVLDVSLTPERAKQLEHAALPELQELLDALTQDRKWPD
jgi:flagellar biosynthesis/type III secretory pathway protein FliH